MQLKSVGEVSSVLTEITQVLNTTSLGTQSQYLALSAIGEKHNLTLLKQAISQSSLNREQIKSILVGSTLERTLIENTASELTQTLATDALSNAQAGTTTSTLGLGTAFKGLGASIKASTKSMLTFMATNPVGWLITVAAAIGAAVLVVTKLHDALTVSLDEQKEKLQEAKDSYENAKTELQELENELENTKKAIAELQNAEYLSWVDQEELERLREVTKELELQKELKQDEQLKAASNLYSENKETFNKQFTSSYGNTSVSDLKQQLSSGNIGLGQLQTTKNITDMVAALQYLNEEKKNLTDPNEIAEFDSYIEDITDSLKSNGQDYLSSISSYKQNILEIASIRDLTDEEQEFYDYISSMQKMIYEFYSPATWNTLEFDSILDTESIEVTRDELIALAQAGTIDEETIKGYKNLYDAIENSEIITEDSETKLEAFINELISLAEKAKDTGEVFNSYAPWDYTETISQLDTLKDKFNVLDNTFSKLYDSDEQIGFEDFSSINDAFSDLKGIEGYIERLQKAGQNTEEVRSVMEDLIYSYLYYSGVLDNITEDNKKLVTSMLEEMGVANANEIVMAVLSGKIYSLATAESVAAQHGLILANVTAEEINALIAEGSISAQTGQQLAYFALQKQLTNGHVISTEADCQNLMNLAKTAGYSESVILRLGNLKAKLKNSSVSEEETSNINTTIKEIFANAQTDAAKIDFSLPELKYNGRSNTQKAIADTAKSTDNAIESTKEEFEELFDFFDRRLKVLANALSLLKSNLENVTGSFAKNRLIDAEVNLNAEKINNYTDALSMYTQKANEALAKLPSDIAWKIQNGAVDLTTFLGDSSEDVVDAVKDYENWADKVADCRQELADLKETIRQLELEKFNNIIDDFTNQFDIREDANSLIDKQIALFEEAGQLIGESFYTAQADQAKKQLAILEQEKASLIDQLSSSLSSGRVEQGTEEWLEMVNALSDVDGNILECQKSIEEFDNTILELHTEIFDRIQEQFSNLDSELENLIGLLDDFDVSDDKGNWTKEGLAQLGLLAQQYELAEYQIRQYNDEINELNRQYLAGKYSATEYADKLADLTSSQWDAVNSCESVKDAILDLNETRIDAEIDGIEKETDAYKELIDAQIDALKAAKDLHDYEQSIAEKTKTVTELERQIAAMQNDDTAATVAKRRKLEEQLAEARNELQELEYDHSIETQENTLNTQYEQYEAEKNAEIEALKVTLENRELIIAQSFENVRANADLIGQQISYIAQQHGITVSNALITSWQSGELAIAGYGAVLTAGTSAFIANVIGIENEMWNLQAQANYTANTLAWMFATRADNLINELAASYYSEANLNSMTNALHDSLVNTLERGYNVSGITSALNSITNAANAAANAIRSVGTGYAPTTPNAPSATKSSPSLAYNSIDSSTGETLYENTSNGMIETADYWKKYGSRYGFSSAQLNKLKNYASGTRHSKGNLIITDENGYELKLPKLNNGNYTIANEGSQILTRAQTDNIFDWSKFKPADLIRFHVPNTLASLTLPDMQSRTATSPTLNIENLVTVNGTIDDTNINRMEKVAQNAVTKAFKDFSYECKKKGAW